MDVARRRRGSAGAAEAPVDDALREEPAWPLTEETATFTTSSGRARRVGRSWGPGQLRSSASASGLNWNSLNTEPGGVWCYPWGKASSGDLTVDQVVQEQSL